MKKFISMIALVATMLTTNATVANAQNYDDFNYRLAKSHTTEYIQKGDDAFRMGHYTQAMDEYKRARHYNEYKGRPVIPEHEIDRKMDRCADAMRRSSSLSRPEAARPAAARPVTPRPHHNEEISDAAAAVAGVALLGGLIAAVASSNDNSEAPANNNVSTLVDVTCNGLSYTTTAANTGCSILSVKNEFDYTVVELEFINSARNSTTLRIDKNTYLKDRSNGEKLSLRDVEGISVKGSTRVDGGDSHVFRLYFDRISDRCSEVDLVESNSSSWKFYHVPVRR